MTDSTPTPDAPAPLTADQAAEKEVDAFQARAGVVLSPATAGTLFHCMKRVFDWGRLSAVPAALRAEAPPVAGRIAVIREVHDWLDSDGFRSSAFAIFCHMLSDEERAAFLSESAHPPATSPGAFNAALHLETAPVPVKRMMPSEVKARDNEIAEEIRELMTTSSGADGKPVLTAALIRQIGSEPAAQASVKLDRFADAATSPGAADHAAAELAEIERMAKSFRDGVYAIADGCVYGLSVPDICAAVANTARLYADDEHVSEEQGQAIIERLLVECRNSTQVADDPAAAEVDRARAQESQIVECVMGSWRLCKEMELASASGPIGTLCAQLAALRSAAP